MALATIATMAVLATATAALMRLGGDEPERGPVIATVDGRAIYLSDARSRMQGLSSVHGSIEDVLGEDWPDEILGSLVDDKLIQAESARRSIEVTAEELGDHIEELRAMFGSEEEFDRWLTTQGINLAELERRVLLQTIASRLYEDITGAVTVPPSDVREYYRSHQKRYIDADGSTVPLYMVKASIRDKLLKQQRDQAFAGWLEQARAEAEVVVVDDGWWRSLA